ncbi:hypothetical protein E2562_017817 [Oryza meyeriana var. granulata]|uniref:Uncharacterized protein n=1 Tax=Oryza meyeriana var. granulata TaxID=110450 RepID=A0A6G1BN52_9ORYZ|nr:hypothetical protein E2562_017817 [Oryza meyeriana var. granulata]
MVLEEGVDFVQDSESEDDNFVFIPDSDDDSNGDLMLDFSDVLFILDSQPQLDGLAESNEALLLPDS